MPPRRRPATTRVAIAGCGRIAFLLEQDPLRYKPCTHLGALRYFAQKDKTILPVALCDTDLTRARAAAQFLVHGRTEVLRARPVLSAVEGDGDSKTMVHGKKPALVTQSFADLLKTKPDLLVIAASTAAHFSMLTAALKARVPRIIIEKPVAFSAEEAQKLRQLARKSSSVILPNYERRYHPKYIRLKQQISQSDTKASYRGFFAAGGKSLYATSDGDEGVLLHDTTHLLDLAQYLFGPVKKYAVVAEKKRHVLYLEHVRGAGGFIETNLGIGVFHLELEVRLADRRITVGNGFQTTERIATSRHYRGLKSYAEPQRTGDKKFPVAKNPFVQLYREALYGAPDNAHFFEALDNVSMLTGAT
ncbi:MAG: Gfo/Idh/MocA family oxidoreductase [Turneriella sp.]